MGLTHIKASIAKLAKPVNPGQLKPPATKGTRDFVS